MSSVYKIESYSDLAVREITRYIRNKGGKFVVLGSAILTNHCFHSTESLSLMPFIANISGHISEVDWHTWEHSLRSVA